MKSLLLFQRLASAGCCSLKAPEPQIVTYIKIKITLGNIIGIQQFVAQIIVLCHCALQISESVPDNRPDHNCCFQSTPLRLTHTRLHTQKTGKEVDQVSQLGEELGKRLN